MLEDRWDYRSCIVRAWREQVGQSGHDLRLTLEVPSSGVRHGFSTFQELVDALRLHLAITGEDDRMEKPDSEPMATTEGTNHLERPA